MHAPLEPQGASGVGAVDGAIGEQVDERVATWRQGDCVVEDDWFLYRTSAQNPLTDDGEAAVVEGAENAETSVLGFAILTQVFARPLMERMSERHDRQSGEGRALRSLREIRVRAAPSWDADAVELTFWFVRNDDEPAFEIDNWELCLTALPQPESTSERFVHVDGVVLTLDDLTARDFVESDPLDLDHLSTREG